METFSTLLVICAGNSPVPGEFPAQRPVTRSFDVFFDLCLNKWLSKQSWGCWFERLSRPSWRHCNVMIIHNHLSFIKYQHELTALNCEKGFPSKGGSMIICARVYMCFDFFSALNLSVFVFFTAFDTWATWTTFGRWHFQMNFLRRNFLNYE